MSLSLRNATMADADLLWRWANDPEMRRNAMHKADIPFSDHVAWLQRKLASPDTRILIFDSAEMPVGQVRFDIEDGSAEIDISVAPGQRGRGYGRVMLLQAIDCLRREGHDGVRIRASVLDHNLPSLSLFKACGFKQTGVVGTKSGGQLILFELPRPE